MTNSATKIAIVTGVSGGSSADLAEVIYSLGLFDTDNLHKPLSSGTGQNWLGVEQNVVRAEGLEPSWAV
jgi:hypothetical protein